MAPMTPHWPPKRGSVGTAITSNLHSWPGSRPGAGGRGIGDHGRPDQRKVRDRIDVAVDISEDEAARLALASPLVVEALAGQRAAPSHRPARPGWFNIVI